MCSAKSEYLFTFVYLNYAIKQSPIITYISHKDLVFGKALDWEVAQSHLAKSRLLS